MFDFYLNYLDGRREAAEAMVLKNGNTVDYEMRHDYPFDQIASVDIVLNRQWIKAGTEGFYLLPGGWGKCKIHECALGYFHHREDTVFKNIDAYMPILGLAVENQGFLASVTGMAENSSQLVTIQADAYQLAFRIDIDGEMPYEPIRVHQMFLDEKPTYSAMARAYRAYKLECGFTPLKDKLNDEIQYAAESAYVRIRHGWKPVPCSIPDQTAENEPPMHVACTFKDVEDIIHAYKAAGIEKVEFCLVGWNIKGHDGRWPQILPVEESLGGEEGLRSLIKTANDAGYRVVCHTNSTDAYSIADNFDLYNIARTRNGDVSIETTYWAGGRTYNVCPKRAMELGEESLKPVADLGFRGLHYIDVITCTVPRKCYHPDHPVNKKEAGKCFDELFLTAKKLFGGAACESSYEYSMRNVDYILYASFLRDTDDQPIVDEYIPFFELVFHGILLYNPYAATVNAAISQDEKNKLKWIECGGRPAVYYYSKFVSDGKDWMGDTDFTVASPEKIQRDTNALKMQMDQYNELQYLQYEFMENHEKIADNIYQITYSDGSVVTVDYNEMKYTLKKG